jgi:opacity protein-like surface antigen
MMKSVIFLSLLLIAPTVCAQNYTPRGEIFGSVGGGKAYDDEGSIGKGVDFGGGIGYRLTPRFGIEGQVNRISYNRDLPLSARFEGTAVFTTANVLYHFTTSKAQPYVIGGLGFVHHENRARFAEESTTFIRSTNGIATNFGAGVKIFLSKKFSLRPEFRVFIADTKGSGVEPPFSVWRGSIGFSYHW